MTDSSSSTPPRIKNFGRNVSFKVENYSHPRTEDKVLELLESSRKSSVRVAGARHSWNEAVATDKTLLDLSKLKIPDCQNDDDERTVECIEAGRIVSEILKILKARDKSLPTFGIIGKQSIAGAISTATHGSGHSSMSHYVVAAIGYGSKYLDEKIESYANVAPIILDAISAFRDDVRAARQIKSSPPLKR